MPPFLHVTVLFHRDLSLTELQERARAVLPRGENRRFGRSESRKRSYYAGRAALASTFERLGAAATVTAQAEYGYLVATPARYFVNVSHTREVAAAVVASHPVGIDIEWSQRDASRVLDRISSAAERSAAPSGIALWSAKEAFSKATGLGIKFGLAGLVVMIGGNPPYAASTTLKGPLPLTDPAVWQTEVEGYFVSLCAERELFLGGPGWVVLGRP